MQSRFYVIHDMRRLHIQVSKRFPLILKLELWLISYLCGHKLTKFNQTRILNGKAVLLKVKKNKLLLLLHLHSVLQQVDKHKLMPRKETFVKSCQYCFLKCAKRIEFLNYIHFPSKIPEMLQFTSILKAPHPGDKE